jgi:hypothetical protein
LINFTLDLTQFHRRVQQTKQALERDVQNAVTRATKHGADVAKGGGWKDRTGRLRATIISKGIGWSANVYWGAFQTQMPYALWVDQDTKPHDIPSDLRPPGKPLSFWWERMGRQFVGYHVRHPGTRGFNFMAVASRQSREFLVQDMRGGFINLHSVWT